MSALVSSINIHKCSCVIWKTWNYDILQPEWHDILQPERHDILQPERHDILQPERQYKTILLIILPTFL